MGNLHCCETSIQQRGEKSEQKAINIGLFLAA
jgi:hypothetical protein